MKELQEKEERKQKRLEKQKEKEEKSKEINRTKKSTSADGPTKGLSFKVGGYVVVNYEDQIFPGIILEIDKIKKEFRVNCMEKHGPYWKWPRIEDILMYPENHIVCSIKNPKLTNVEKELYEISDFPKKFNKLFK